MSTAKYIGWFLLYFFVSAIVIVVPITLIEVYFGIQIPTEFSFIPNALLPVTAAVILIRRKVKKDNIQ